jgi:hypothetical protein
MIRQETYFDSGLTFQTAGFAGTMPMGISTVPHSFPAKQGWCMALLQ